MLVIRLESSVDSLGIMLVISLGLEPKTHSLEGCCSIQLSYETPPLLEFGCKGKNFFENNQIF